MRVIRAPEVGTWCDREQTAAGVAGGRAALVTDPRREPLSLPYREPVARLDKGYLQAKAPRIGGRGVRLTGDGVKEHCDAQ